MARPEMVARYRRAADTVRSSDAPARERVHHALRAVCAREGALHIDDEFAIAALSQIATTLEALAAGVPAARLDWMRDAEMVVGVERATAHRASMMSLRRPDPESGTTVDAARFATWAIGEAWSAALIERWRDHPADEREDDAVHHADETIRWADVRAETTADLLTAKILFVLENPPRVVM